MVEVNNGNKNPMNMLDVMSKMPAVLSLLGEINEIRKEQVSGKVLIQLTLKDGSLVEVFVKYEPNNKKHLELFEKINKLVKE